MIMIGDLVELTGSELIGIVVDKGERRSRLIGDGRVSECYVEVKWFNDRYNKTAQFSPSCGILKVISKK